MLRLRREHLKVRGVVVEFVAVDVVDDLARAQRAAKLLLGHDAVLMATAALPVRPAFPTPPLSVAAGLSGSPSCGN